MKKIISAQQAISLIEEGSTVMIGGFLSCGAPDKLIDELAEQNISKLVTGAGCMCCWLLGMGIGSFFIDKEKVLNSKMKWKWLLLVTSLAFFSLFIVYVLYKW